MKEHFTSRVGRVDDVDKRAAFESTACTHSPLALLADQKVEKNSARDHRSERARASECPDSIQKATSQKTCKSRH